MGPARTRADSDRSLRSFAVLALSTGSRAEYLREAALELERVIGCDLVFMGHFPSDDDAALRNIAPSCWSAFRQNAAAFMSELAPLNDAALACGGVAVDTEVLDARTRSRSGFYSACVRPNRSKTFMHVVLSMHGRVPTILQLGRTGGSDRSFTRHDADCVRDLVPVLALGSVIHDASARRGATDAGERLRLTPRERDITQYVALGFTNKEIALACGTSPNTVRNQLARVFEKLSVTTRSELTRIAIAEGIARPS